MGISHPSPAQVTPRLREALALLEGSDRPGLALRSLRGSFRAPYDGADQQDAAEFLHYVLDALEDEADLGGPALVGDAAKRWALTMPPTLAMFRSRVRQVYGLDGRTPFEIWLHPYARGAAPGRGRELVATESDYACVIDGDVLVLRLGDREVAPTPELVRAFDGDVETVYDADYRKPEPVKDLRGASVSSSRYQNFRDAIDVPNPYVTTYKTAFTPQSRFLEDAPPTDKMAAHYTCPHGAATTTYRAMFAGREPRDFHDSILEEPSILRRFVAPAPPARPPTTSTSRADFVAFPQGPKRAPAPRALGRAPPGARWKPSEYRAAYAGRAPYAAPGLGAGPRGPAGDGTGGPRSWSG